MLLIACYIMVPACTGWHIVYIPVNLHGTLGHCFLITAPPRVSSLQVQHLGYHLLKVQHLGYHLLQVQIWGTISYRSNIWDAIWGTIFIDPTLGIPSGIPSLTGYHLLQGTISYRGTISNRSGIVRPVSCTCSVV